MRAAYETTLSLLEPEAEPDNEYDLEIYNQLKKLRWVDLDKGQLEFYDMRPAIALPCALIRVELTRAETIGNNDQRCTGRVIIRLAFDYVGSTSKASPATIRQQSLEYFDLLEGVYRAVQGKSGKGVGKFERVNAMEQTRPDGLKVLEMTFNTTWIDKSAK
ncbi:MAG: hypothetical protein ACO1NU_08660 [Arcticibacter sp.]